MKYEVIKEFPNCGEFKLGRKIEVTEILAKEASDNVYTIAIYSFNGLSKRIVYVGFHPSQYPDIFKPIEDKPKWIDERMIVADISSVATPRCATMYIHRNDLYTREDMIEFASYLRGHSSSLYNEVFITPKLDDWVNKKLQS